MSSAEDERSRPLPVAAPLRPIARQWGLDQLGSDANYRMPRELESVVVVGDARRARFQSWGQRWTTNATSAADAANHSAVEIVCPIQPGCVVCTELHIVCGAAGAGWSYQNAPVLAGAVPASVAAVDPTVLMSLVFVGTVAPVLVAILGTGALTTGSQVLALEPAVMFGPAQRFLVYGNAVNQALTVTAKGYFVGRDTGHNLLQDNGPGA